MAYDRGISPLHGRFAVAGSVFSWIIILFTVIALTPTWAQEAKQPEYQGGAGRKIRPAVKVPFKPGPFGPDGKVYAVVPDAKARRFPNEVETPQEREAEMRAFAGASIPTSKQLAKELSPEQLSLLNWNPGVLDAVQNPILGSLFKGDIKNPLQEPKGFKSASLPVKGKDFSGFGDTGYFPPDGGIAAGPYHVVEVVNSSVNVYDKNGNLLSSQTLNNFFSGLGTAGSDFLYDPSIYYDQAESRFWMVAVSEHDSPNRSNILVAVTADSSVSDGWYEYALDATVDGGGSTGNWCDYPHFGLDADAIYLSCNQFSFPSSASSFQYAKVRVITKTQLMTGSCCSWWDFWNLKEGFLNLSTAFTVRPALERWVGFGAGDFWVDAEGSGGSGDTVKIWKLSNPTKCCDGSGGPTLDGNEQGVGSYDSAPGAAQPNAVHALDTGGTRVLYATYQFGHLSFGQTISCSNGGTHACAAFTEVDVSGYPSMSNVNDWTWSQSGEDIYYPFVDQNANSDKTMVYTRSDGSTVYPGAYYRGIPRSTSCTGCLGGEGTMASGQANYSVIDGSGRNRWGDYQGASNDSDFLGIWVEGEYVSSTDSWHKVIVPTYNSYGPIDSPSPTSIAFGNQAIYSSAATQYVLFKNNGNAALYTSSTQVTGDSDFYITYDGCRGQTLQSGSGCYEGVSFYPNSIGAGTGYIIVYDNTPGTYAYSTLTGTGVQAGSVTSISSSLNPSTYHQSVTFTAHVVASTAGTPGGTVTFYDGVTALGSGTLSGGLAHFTTVKLGGGAHTISATYGGSPKYLTSSASLTQQVNVAPSTTKVVSSKNPIAYGQSVTFTGTVTSGAGTPTHGGMTFKDGTKVLANVEVANGVASYTTTALSAGTHSITASYHGSLIFSQSTSAPISQVVHKAGTTTTATSSVNPSSWHQTVTFTAKVTSHGGIPTGTVNFKSGTTVLGAGTLNGSGIATLATNTMTVGAHSITAVYVASTNFATSTSTVLTQTVKTASTKTALVSSKNPSTHGTAVTFTATVTPAFGGTATGKVNFKSGTSIIGSGTVSGNKATFTTSTLSVGTHSMTAVYQGDTHLTVSTSPSVTQVVH
jgi:hypothetical protein